MPNVNGSFQGQTLIRPGVYYYADVSATLPFTPLPAPPVLFIGYSYGLKPLVPTTFSDPQSMMAALRGGPASAFVDFIFNPSNQLNGASLVTFINASENTQATYAMKGASTTLLNWTTTDYGLPSNLMQVQCQTGSIAGVAITLFDGYSGQTAFADNLGVPFTMSYTGGATGVTYTVTAANNVATVLTVTNNSAPAQSFTIYLNNYSTVGQVVEYINGTGFYVATMIGDGTMPSSMLDGATGIALPKPVSGVNQNVNVTASLGAIVYWSTQYASSFATAAISAGVTSSATTVPSTLAYTHFSGGTNVPPILQDYANAFNAGLNVPAWVVVADTNTLGVIGLGTAHAVQASGITARKPRRFVSGSNVGDAISVATAAAQGMDATQASYVYPGIQRTNLTTGLNQTYGGLYVAAAVAGMMAGNPVATPLTNKYLVGNGPEVTLTDAQINTLQQAGVMPVTTGNNGVPKIESDLTSWQIDNNPENVFNQQIACQQSLEYALINGMSPYVGSIESPLSIGVKRKAVQTILNNQMYSPVSGNGVLAAYDPKSISLVYTSANQTLQITVNVQFVQQDRFIPITVFVQPLNLTA